MSKINVCSIQDNGKSFKAEKGDFITVSLEENKSTGYKWVDDTPSSERKIRFLKSFEINPTSESGDVGVKIFVYQFHSSGKIQINQVSPEGGIIKKFIITFVSVVSECLDILIVVDVIGALGGSLQDNVYLFDTEKYMASWQEGQHELYTACKDGENIRWRVTAISPDNDVEIVNFTGQMVNEKVCVPKKKGSGDNVFWKGKVKSRTKTGNYQYSVTFSMDRMQANFDLSLRVE